MGAVGISGAALRRGFLTNNELRVGRPSRLAGHTWVLLEQPLVQHGNVFGSAAWVSCSRSSSDKCCFKLSANQRAAFGCERHPATEGAFGAETPPAPTLLRVGKPSAHRDLSFLTLARVSPPRAPSGRLSSRRDRSPRD